MKKNHSAFITLFIVIIKNYLFINEMNVNELI